MEWDRQGVPADSRSPLLGLEARALSDVRHFVDEVLPEDGDSEAIQVAVAYDLLRPLDDMAERSRTALQKRHH